jgi:D-alanyl-D-alanine carboxypeptidase
MVRYIVLLVLVLVLGGHIARADDTQDLLDEIVQGYVNEDDPFVVYLSTPDGVWSVTGGFAREGQQTRLEDRFRIGSMSKTFVAVAALMLVEDGVFALDDPASAWLPDSIVQNVANTKSVTIRQLLAMRSGIDDYLGREAFWQAVEADPQREWTAEEVLTYIHGDPALFAPDTEFSYSNSNYILLELILEEASEMGLHDLIRQRILEPLKMEDTYTQISEFLPGGFVEAYGSVYDDGVLENLSEVNDGAGLGDGGLVSNVVDVHRFYEALLQDQTLLSPALMDELLAFSPVNDFTHYSLGLNEWQTPSGAAWGHAGGVIGFLSIGAYLPEQGVTLIILSGSQAFAPEEMALDILGQIVE